MKQFEISMWCTEAALAVSVMPGQYWHQLGVGQLGISLSQQVWQDFLVKGTECSVQCAPVAWQGCGGIHAETLCSLELPAHRGQCEYMFMPSSGNVLVMPFCSITALPLTHDQRTVP